MPESGGAKPVGAVRRRCKNDDAQRRAAENACSAFWKFLVGLRKSGGGLAAIRWRCFRCQKWRYDENLYITMKRDSESVSI